MPFPCRAPHLDVDFAPACVLMWPHPGRLHEDGTGERWEMSPWPDPEPEERVESVRQQRAVDDDWVGFTARQSLNRVVPAEVDADPDTAFELGRIAGYDEAMREVSQGEPSGARHAEHVIVEWAYESDCLEGECAHRDEDGEPEDMSVCPNVPPFEVCVGCMEDEGRGSDPEQWDDVPLMPWPCPAALRAAGVHDG